MKGLLQTDFFSEETGIKVELVKPEDLKEPLKELKFWLRVDPKRRKPQHKENEVIQFEYDLEKDDPDKVAQEMVSLIYLLNQKTYRFKKRIYWLNGTKEDK